MDDVKPSLYIFIGVDGEDLLEQQFEVDNKPTLITQDQPAQYVSEPALEQTTDKRRSKKLKNTQKKRKIRSSARPAKNNIQSGMNKGADIENTVGASGNEQVEVEVCETSVVDHSVHNDFQISNVVPRADCLFNSENNNYTELLSYSVAQEDCIDPLQNHCALEITEPVPEEPVCKVEQTPAAKENTNSNIIAVDIKSLTPYIKKLCITCQRITELISNQLDSVENKRCNICDKSLAYCCKLCLEINNLNNMYIHIFKCHYNSPSEDVANESFICSKCCASYANPLKLKHHEMVCDVLPNLFCPFCPSKMQTKPEMRQHMVLVHTRQFKAGELERMLNKIVKEGDTIMNMLTLHSGFCNTCRKRVPLTHRPTYCLVCQTKLVYRCKDPACTSLVFVGLSSLQMHLRYHANEGWTTDANNARKANSKLCHICRSFEGDHAEVNEHMSTMHSDIVMCKCDLCGKDLKNVRVWKRHRERFCTVTHPKLRCGHCRFGSFEKTRLRRHLRNVHTHLYTGERPRCDKCGISWAGLYRLRWHEGGCSGDFKVERARQRELWAARRCVTLS